MTRPTTQPAEVKLPLKEIMRRAWAYPAMLTELRLAAELIATLPATDAAAVPTLRRIRALLASLDGGEVTRRGNRTSKPDGYAVCSLNLLGRLNPSLLELP